MPFDNLPPDINKLLAKELSTKDVSALQRANKSTKTALDPVMKSRRDEMVRSIESKIKSMPDDSIFHETWAKIRVCLAFKEINNNQQSDYDHAVQMLGLHLTSRYMFQKDRAEHRFWVGLYGMYKMVRARAKNLDSEWDWKGPDA